MWSWYANKYVIPDIKKIKYDGIRDLPLERKPKGNVLNIVQNNIGRNMCESCFVITKTGFDPLCMVCKNAILKSVSTDKNPCTFAKENIKFGWDNESIQEIILSTIEVPIYAILKNFDTPVNHIDDSKINFDLSLIIGNIHRIRKQNNGIMGFYMDHRDDVCMNYFSSRTLSPRVNSHEDWINRFNVFTKKIDKLQAKFRPNEIEQKILDFEI